MTTSNHITTTYHINDNTRLSLSKWDANGRFYAAIAISRKVGNDWRFDSNTAIETSFDKRDKWRRDYFLTDVSAPMVANEMGQEIPIRFFSQNAINTKITKGQ